MKTKHNKKRNTAFVFEALIREATVAIIKENHKVKDKAVQIIKACEERYLSEIDPKLVN